MTIPIEIRHSLRIDEGGYLEVPESDREIRLRKLVRARPPGPDAPIRTLVGAGESRRGDISKEHYRHLAAAEVDRWRRSSLARAGCSPVTGRV